MVIDTLVNPITRTSVQLQPPLEVTSAADHREVLAKFAMYCQQAWEGPIRNDPKVIWDLRKWSADDNDDA